MRASGMTLRQFSSVHSFAVPAFGLTIGGATVCNECANCGVLRRDGQN
jgi:hypothetical protein